jgi:hypothetical protein
MDRGYVFLWRKLLDNPIMADEACLFLFIHLLLNATHKKQTRSVTCGQGKVMVDVEPGEVIIGERKWAAKFGWSKTTFRRKLERLQKMGVVTRKPDRHFSIVRLCKWETYQHCGLDKRTADRTADRTTDGPPVDHQRTENNNGDNGKKVKKKFIVPSLEDVSAYCAERGNRVDPQQFIDYYEAKGWMIGKNKMKSWQAAVRTWEQRDKREKQDKGDFSEFVLEDVVPSIEDLQ